MRFNFSMTLVSYTVSVFTVTKLQKCTTVNLNIKSGRELTADMASPLWTIYAATYGSALYHCFPRCEEDERCVGIELCRIRPDYSRCRGCCEWFVNWHKGIALTTSDKCRYIELDNRTNVNETGTNVALHSSTTASSVAVFGPNVLSHRKAVDGIALCPHSSYTFHTYEEVDPWVKINLQRIVMIWRIIVYNRQDCCGSRLVNLNVTYSNGGQTNSCGYYPGSMAKSGDVILFQCPPDARGSSVKLMVQSPPGIKNYFSLCEVEVYQKKYD
ncbi:fucolectin-5-like [Crassostrea angulata]|uniref:fucolectin-5-like n=1 Tax=Magallana angulata TaxID=2784310 RepID=UPI0022B10C00|nr:fucolectin-5-like [Crassostrea angulata]